MLFFILRSFNTFCVLLFSTQHSLSGSALFLGSCSPFSSEQSLPFKGPFRFAASLHLITLLLDITNWAKQHWNSISSTCQVQIIGKYKEPLQLHCARYELCAPAFIGPNEMGDRVDDIDTMFDWCHRIAESGKCFGVPAFLFQSRAFFFGSLM